MDKKFSLTIAVPVFNEEATLEKITKEILVELKKITNNYELLFVDDGSTDSSPQIMQKLQKRYRNINIVTHKKNRGFSGAIITSLTKASKDHVLLAPADGQFKFKNIKKFVTAIDGVDAVLAYRTLNTEPTRRKIQSFFYYHLSALILGLKVKDIPTISLWKTKVIRKLKTDINPRSNMILPYFVYQASRLNYKFAEVPIDWRRRKIGKAKGDIDMLIIFSTLKEMLKLFWDVRFTKFISR